MVDFIARQRKKVISINSREIRYAGENKSKEILDPSIFTVIKPFSMFLLKTILYLYFRSSKVYFYANIPTNIQK